MTLGYFQDVEDEIEAQYLEDEELNEKLQNEFEPIPEDEKYEITLTQMLENQKKPEKKRITKTKKTKKITILNSKNVQEITPKKVNFEFGEKVIKNFTTSDFYSKYVNYKPGNVISSSSEIVFDDISQIKRKNFALGNDGSTIFIHGGENKEKLDDLIFYELGDWYSFEFENEEKPPAMSNHFLTCNKGNLYLFDDFETYYQLNYNATSPSWTKLQFKTISKKQNKKIIKATPILLDNVIYIFGGLNSDEETVSNSMMMIHLSTDGLTIKKIDPENSPSGRYNYSCHVYSHDSIIYFGGQNGEKYFNDLYVYKTELEYFQQIDCSGLVPPPLHSALLFSFNSNDEFYLHGGETYGSIESSIYKLDIQGKKWSSVINSEELNNFPIAGHKSVVLHPHQKNFYMFGGYIDLNENLSENSIKLLHFSEFENEKSHYAPIIEYVTDLYNTKKMTNFSFFFKMENQGDFEIKAHKEFLSFRCDYLKGIFEENEISAVITDFDHETFQRYIQYLYSGSINAQGDQIQNLLEISKKSGKHFPVLNQICKMNLYLNSNLDFYKQLQSDLYTFKHSGELTDVKINLCDDDKIFKSYNAHKFILFRSSHFSDAFKSGMKESIEGEIDFVGVSEVCMDTILHYLYTNECLPSPQNAVEVLVQCDLFRLDDLAEKSRDMIKKHLNVENILDLSAFAGLYHDSSLIQSTARFLSAHFEQFSEDCLDDLPSNFKLVFYEIYSKKLKKKLHKKFIMDRSAIIGQNAMKNKVKTATTRDRGNHGARKKTKEEEEEENRLLMMTVQEKDRIAKKLERCWAKYEQENQYFE